MQKLLTAALACAILSGCGSMGSPLAAKRTGSIQAQSATGVAKGVRATIRGAFKTADKNANGWLSLAEYAETQPLATRPNAQAGFDALDVNKDKKVRWTEYLVSQNLPQLVTFVRYEAGKSFALLDKNGDKVLVETELVSPLVTMAAADKNKNGKLTPSEFEDAFAAAMAAGPDPVEPPAPAPAPGGDQPAPAPGGDQPAPAPAPGGDVPAVEPTEPTQPVEPTEPAEEPAAEPTEG